jgi:hypothetical protein
MLWGVSHTSHLIWQNVGITSSLYHKFNPSSVLPMEISFPNILKLIRQEQRKQKKAKGERVTFFLYVFGYPGWNFRQEKNLIPLFLLIICTYKMLVNI